MRSANDRRVDARRAGERAWNQSTLHSTETASLHKLADLITQPGQDSFIYSSCSDIVTDGEIVLRMVQCPFGLELNLARAGSDPGGILGGKRHGLSQQKIDSYAFIRSAAFPQCGFIALGEQAVGVARGTPGHLGATEPPKAAVHNNISRKWNKFQLNAYSSVTLTTGTSVVTVEMTLFGHVSAPKHMLAGTLPGLF
ncbi:hypothetical protein CRENBAI_013345 [Crenichthys baileyi]|uniref:Uncharacterized protein n=1 Tax=Crenichthys baileyi TaxID=28760 RepID=A0AAV9R276_9TELE